MSEIYQNLDLSNDSFLNRYSYIAILVLSIYQNPISSKVVDQSAFELPISLHSFGCGLKCKIHFQIFAVTRLNALLVLLPNRASTEAANAGFATLLCTACFCKGNNNSLNTMLT